MYIDNNITIRPTFNANIPRTKVLTDTLNYMEIHSTEKGDWNNTAKDLMLTKKIIKAIKKHPSHETVMIDETFRYGEMFSARGVISSGRATLIDTEPARCDSIAPVLNIMRRIIDPENKISFNKLMGEEYSKDYQPWWDKNIKPIWDSVNERFRESTFFEGNHDKQFNHDFNAQSGELNKDFYPVQTKNNDKHQKIGDEITTLLKKFFG